MTGWKYCKAFVVSLFAGALIGLAFGFAANENWQGRAGLSYWLGAHPAEAVFWTLAGALLGGCAIYLWRLLHSQ
jgi:hypothetical protein